MAFALLWSKKRRDNERRTKLFSRTNKFWNQGGFNSRDNIGTMNYIWKDAHNYFIKNNEKSMISFEEFERYYFYSGEKMKLDKILNKPINIRHYGRTYDDLCDIASKFRRYLYENNINISFEVAFNIVYIRVIDETYLGYVAEVSVLNILQNEFPNYTFEFLNENDDVKYFVDILVEKNNELVLGLSIKSTTYKNTTSEYIKRNVKNFNNRGQLKFTQDYNVPVTYIYYYKKYNQNLGNKENKINNFEIFVENLNEIRSYL